MRERLQLAGQTFGRLYVIEYVGVTAVQRHSLWRCLCSCGDDENIVIVQGRNLVNGGTKSCGCLSKEVTSTRSTTHGKSRTTEYRIWSGIKDRCLNPNSRDFPGWGGRGIKMCQQWQESFETFLDDVGGRPGKEFSLDRVDNEKGYEPGNVRWATMTEQHRNRRGNILLTFGGVTLPLPTMAEQYGMTRDSLQHRLDQGWSVERSLTTPIAHKYNRFGAKAKQDSDGPTAVIN